MPKRKPSGRVEQQVPAFPGNISFNAQHAPIGAFFSFTCGHFGTRGGFGLQIGRPGNQDLFIGVKDGDRTSDAPLKVLPFYQGAVTDEAARYQVEGAADPNAKRDKGLLPYTKEQIRRHYGWATDRWVTDDFEFAIYTPFGGTDESATGSRDYPAIHASLVIDNRRGRQPKTGFFAMRMDERGSRLIGTEFEKGFALRDQFGTLGELAIERNGKVDDDVDGRLFQVMRWNLQSAFSEANAVHLLGNCPGLAFEVLPGERITLRMVLGCYLGNEVTTGIRGRYRYAQRFGSLEDVLTSSLAWADEVPQASAAIDAELLTSSLSPDQQFMVAHATRSYYGSTQLLDVGGEPFWVVNEGEYCMMNTLDLSVDHVFWELKQNPWVVRNLLDRFVRHYSYVDQVKVPKAGMQGKRHAGTKGKHVVSTDASAGPRVLGEALPMDRFDLRPGGLSFTHDMGVHNNFSPAGYSSYELANLVGCFSYMTAEQLCNWSLMAACYVAKTNDLDWLRQNQHIIEACLTSMLNRGGDAGFCQYDSSRCEGGSEITTYDSLDHSLAQTRNNVYMATKSWATYLGLAWMLERVASRRATEALDGAKKVERTILAHAGKDGVLPAVFETDNPGHASRILPAIEGLIYPWYWNDPAMAGSSRLIKTLRRHTVALLKDREGRNFFADGGVKLSSTSNNSWMSKIALFMHVCRAVFKLHEDEKIADLFRKADAAHVRWQTEGESAFWACSDQMVSGVAKGSRYYPRIITSALWMDGLESPVARDRVGR